MGDENSKPDVDTETDTGDGAQPPAVVQPSGTDVIARYLKTLPSSPGVYRMIDAKADVIYVGKARSLKARVSSYSRLSGHTNRIARMILSTVAMEFVTTRTESEALLLEANLIKRFQPRYNVLLRDDKSFPYIIVTRDHEAAMITKHRGARNRKGDYFGPFASAGAVNRTINTLQRAFLLRTCTDAIYESRTRPCLQYQIKRCAAPCTGEIAIDDYAALVEDARRFLRGQSQEIRERLQLEMREASDNLEFERAAEYRNRLWALAYVTSDQHINPDGIEEADVFACHQDAGQTCVQVFFFRTGQNWGNRAYFPRADRALGASEVLESFIAQFYDDKPVPRLILLSHDLPSRELLAEALSTKSGLKLQINVPQRGGKKNLVDHALSNAREALGRRLAESASQRKLLEAVADRFGLDQMPTRIEVYDNSHIQGGNAVGGMIVSGLDGFMKNQYRKFNIKDDTITPGDDYGMMREVLTRRFKRLLKEHGDADPVGDGGQLQERMREGQLHGPEQVAAPHPNPLPVVSLTRLRHDEERGEGTRSHSTALQDGETVAGDSSDNPPPDDTHDPIDDLPVASPWPDLVFVDGGPGQLSIAVEVMAELGISSVKLVGIAKGPDRDAGREHFHTPGAGKSFMLEPRDPVLYFVQRLRDEAHRFAIGSHRQKRKKAFTANPLDEVPGIGPTRKRALLQHFGSAKAVSRAGVEDLKVAPGVSAKMAQTIFDFFHDGGGS